MAVAHICDVRLSTSGGSLTNDGPIFGSDAAIVNVIGSEIALYTSGAWTVRDFNPNDGAPGFVGASEDVPTDAQGVYDVFAYWDGSAIALEVLAWTNLTTRATALARQNGVLVKSGDATRRYIGTVLSYSVEPDLSGYRVRSNETQRGIWNHHHRAFCPLRGRGSDTDEALSSPSDGWDGWGNGQINFVIGLQQSLVLLSAHAVRFSQVAAGSYDSLEVGIRKDTNSGGPMSGSISDTFVQDTLNAYDFAISRVNDITELGSHFYEFIIQRNAGAAGNAWVYNDRFFSNGVYGLLYN
jgi:hypothetical protein